VGEVTENVAAFLKANRRSKVISGYGNPGGGGGYTLNSGKSFTFTLDEMRSMPMPEWKL
jgi:hypothetical protein